MDEGLEILKKQLEKIPKTLKEYVLRGNWEEKIEIVLSKIKLEEYQKTSIENEVMLVLVGLEPKEDLAENITIEAKVDKNISNWMAEDVIKEVIKPVENELNTFVENNHNNVAESEKYTGTTNGVGQSFAQAIVNQAKAMRPIPAAPSNLPTGDKPNDHISYKPNKDPYREPLE